MVSALSMGIDWRISENLLCRITSLAIIRFVDYNSHRLSCQTIRFHMRHKGH